MKHQHHRVCDVYASDNTAAELTAGRTATCNADDP